MKRSEVAANLHGLYAATSSPTPTPNLLPHPQPPFSCPSEYCAEDIEELCKEQREAIAMAEGFGADAQVITCLEVGWVGWAAGLGGRMGSRLFLVQVVCWHTTESKTGSG